ncbi:transporter [Ganoderma sinense ZZ0214-1]|uniref:DNA 3'-5' helicase n=1 Tax=Ganoderma sinense ZZ0214-1 TaxID=1077348 RepID=A0A2G8S5G9_9APHY|nr:transporter [Ganoderma sinense ZZ0214-1]
MRRSQTHTPSSPRPRLSPEQLQELSAKMAEAYGWAPKDFQLRAVQAQLEGQDIIVQAPTGSGKTALAAGPHLWEWPEGEKRFTLMVCPLLSLEEEMVRTFELDFGLKAVALNSKNGACSPIRIREILEMKYQIILLSPEMLQSRTFTDRVLRNSTFMRRMLSMFIDEAHCIVHWGRTSASTVTATLTARVYRGIYSSLHFAQSEAQNVFVNKGNDRSNVSIVVRPFEHPLNTYADLDFLLPKTLRSPSDIPLTYLYVDHKVTGGEIIDHLISQLLEHPMNAARSDNIHNRPVPSGVIRPFNANMSQAYRNNAMAQFRAGNVRILVCTDAAGMGCNIPNIKRVVQWKLPGSFSQFIQRAGRAARGPGQTGVAILLVEKSAYNIDIVSAPAPSIDSKKTKKPDGSGPPRAGRADAKQVREYAIAHGLARGGSKKDDVMPSAHNPI